MRRGYILSLDADQDLQSIFAYIAANSGIKRAEAVLAELEDAFAILAESPSLGRIRYDLSGLPRSWVVLRWLIFYEPVDANRILVLRVVDGSRDLAAVLKLVK